MRGTPSLVLIDRYGLIRKHTFGAADDLASARKSAHLSGNRRLIGTRAAPPA